MNRTRLGILASYRGTNMQAIIDACKAGKLSAQPVVIISNNSDSGALARAKSEGIPGFYLSSKGYPDAEVLDQKIVDTLRKHDVEIVILAGYMKKLGSKILVTFAGRILIIHPALLPKYGGEGMYGIHVHKAVIAAGETESGVTIHVVAGEYDAGPILAQRKVSIDRADTVDSLSRKILAVEHEFYVETLDRIFKGKIKLPQ